MKDSNCHSQGEICPICCSLEGKRLFDNQQWLCYFAGITPFTCGKIAVILGFKWCTDGLQIMVPWQGEIQPMDSGVVCVFCSLLLSSWARYFSQPFRRTRSPSRSRNSSNAGPELSLLYMSSSELCPARQYITPTFRWKFSYIIRQRSTEFIIWSGHNYIIFPLKEFSPNRVFLIMWCLT